MTHATRLHARGVPALAGPVAAIVLALTALALLPAGAAHAAEPTGYGELTRFGEAGDLEGQLDELRTHAIGVDTSDNSVFVLDEPKEPKGAKRTLRLQKFTEAGGKYAVSASVQFVESAPEGEGVEPTVDGLAVDSSSERVYLLTVGVRNKKLAQAAHKPGAGLLVASTLFAFSTKATGSKLEAASGTKTGGAVVGPEELGEQSVTPGQALLEPRGITVDPETGEVIVLAHIDNAAGAEDVLSSANDHYVLQRIQSSGTLGDRYTDSTDVLKPKEVAEGESFIPSPHSPVVVSAGGKEHVYVGFGGIAEVPYDFTSKTAPKRLTASKNPPSDSIEAGITAAQEGGRLTAAPDGTVYGANDSGILNQEPGSEGQGRAGIVALSGADGSLIGWTGGQQMREPEPKQKCVISPLTLTLSPRIAAGSGGTVFALAPEFLLRKIEGEPLIEEIENPPGSGEFEVIETPTFEPLPGPFFGGIVEFGPGGTGCPPASATVPVAKVNNVEVKGEESVKTGSEVTFSSQLKQADAIKVEWDFGDGSTVTESKNQYQATSIKHKFEKEGTFTVTEKIYSDDLASPSQVVYKEGHLTTPTITVTRRIAVGAHPPKALFTAPGEAGVGATVSFENHSSDPNGPEGLPLTYAWNFGDGSPTASTASPTHVYGAAGVYTVTLTVTDHLGLKSTSSQAISIVAPSSPPPPPPPGETGGGGGGTGTTGGGAGGGGGGGGVLSYRVSIAQTSLAVNPAGGFQLKVSCGGQSSCTGSVTLSTIKVVSAGKRKAILKLASGSFSLAGGQAKVVSLRLSGAARSLLKRMHALKAKAVIAARDSSGASHTTTASLTLRVVKRR
jgi:PKD repeat protein